MTNKKRVLTAATICFSCLLTYSQEAKEIIGKVVGTQNDPIEFVNIMLLTKQDSSFVEGCITDEHGVFKFKEYDFDKNYFIELSCIGFQSLKKEIDCNQRDTLHIKMNESNVKLNEIVVSGKILTQKLSNGSIISQINNSVLSSSGTAVDVLERLPGVFKWGEDLTVFGKKRVKIFINDKEVRSNNELDRIKSEDILSVETINNPGAKYATDTDAVLIIRTKNKLPDSFGANLRVRGKMSSRFSQNELLNITYQKGKIDVFASFYNSNTKLTTNNENSQEVKSVNTVWKTHTLAEKWQQNYDYISTEFGINYHLTANQKVSFGYTYDYNKDKYSGINETERFENDAFIYKSDVNSSSENKTDKHLLNLSYTNVVNNNLSLLVSVDYLYRDSEREQFISETTDFNKNDNNINTDFFASKINLDYTINESSVVSLGGEQNWISSENRFITTNSIISNSEDNTQENRYAVYTNYQTRLNKLGVSLGLRYEFFNNIYKSDVYSDLNKTYHNLFPSFVLSLPIRDISMSFALSRKTDRPTFYQLRSGTEYISNYLYEKGNPELIPQSVYNVTYNFLYKYLQLSINYQHINNYIVPKVGYLNDDREILVGTHENINRYDELGLFLSFNQKIGFWNPNWNISFIQPFLSYTNESVKMKYNKPMAFFSLSNALILPKQYKLTIDGQINTSGNNANIYIKPQASLNIGLQKSFFDEKLKLDIRFNDVFASQKSDAIIDEHLITMRMKGFQDTRSLLVGLTYRFNNYKKKYNRINAAESELNRF